MFSQRQQRGIFVERKAERFCERQRRGIFVNLQADAAPLGLTKFRAFDATKMSRRWRWENC
jgi:hypothetical protein